jgi:hypothetical protein
MKAMTRKFEIPIETAQRAARAALNEVERATGCFVVPEVKGQLCKQLAGIMANLEIRGTALTHAGAEKQLANALTVQDKEIKPVILKRRRWK